MKAATLSACSLSHLSLNIIPRISLSCSYKLDSARLIQHSCVWQSNVYKAAQKSRHVSPWSNFCNIYIKSFWFLCLNRLLLLIFSEKSSWAIETSLSSNEGGSSALLSYWLFMFVFVSFSCCISSLSFRESHHATANFNLEVFANSYH